MPGLVERLAEYLDSAARTPFVWGVFDCLLFPADWRRLVDGVDPAERFRGTYDSERGALRILTTHGGFLGLANTEMTRAGLQPTTRPVAGDVGLVEVVSLAGPSPAGAIFNGETWAVLPRGGGLAFGRYPLVKAWSAIS